VHQHYYVTVQLGGGQFRRMQAAVSFRDMYQPEVTDLSMFALGMSLENILKAVSKHLTLERTKVKYIVIN
jgi:hypothetical protein